MKGRGCVLQLQNTILEMIARGETLERTARRLCEEVDRLAVDAACSVCGGSCRLDVPAGGADRRLERHGDVALPATRQIRCRTRCLPVHVPASHAERAKRLLVQPNPRRQRMPDRHIRLPLLKTARADRVRSAPPSPAGSTRSGWWTRRCGKTGSMPSTSPFSASTAARSSASRRCAVSARATRSSPRALPRGN